MKKSTTILITLALGIIGSIYLLSVAEKHSLITYSAPDNPVVEQVQGIIEQEDDLEAATRLLEEATRKLDEEERRLLEEIEAASSTYHAVRAEKEARIAEINKIRSSF